MGIKDVPETYEAFEALLDGYEAAHFGFDEGGRRVADSTMALMLTFYPSVAARPMEVFSRALMDDPLLAAFRYRRPPDPRWCVPHRAGLRVAGPGSRPCCPRGRGPCTSATRRRMRSYPDGYEIEALGTFPRGCPVPR